MAKFVKIVDGVIAQAQPYAGDGFIEAPDGVVCGQLDNGDGTFSNPPPAPLTADQLEAALDAHIDAVAKAKGYDSRVTAALRAGYVNPWQTEGIAFGTWMDSCYVAAYAIQAEVEAGTRAVPTEAELIAEMPAMVWPE